MRNKTPAQIAFLEAVKAVNTASAKLRKPDRFKRIPYVLAQDRDKLMELHRAVGKAAERYLKYKLGPNMDRSLNDLTEYSKGRVHCAQDLLNATEKLKVLRGDELNEAQTNEREAKEGLARRLGDKAEERAYANRPKPAPQPILN